MINDLRKAWQLMKFGACVNKALNILLFVIFLVGGLFGELVYLSLKVTNSFNWIGYDYGAFLVLAALSFPSQFLVTTDVAHVVQSSSYKKRIQTKMFSEVSLIAILIAMTIFTICRGIAAVILPECASILWDDLPWLGAIAIVVLIFTVVMYKYFWAAMIMLYAVVVTISGGAGYQSAVKGYNVLFATDLPGIVNIVIGYALVLLGVGITYLLSLALYKKPFSKAAFGATMSKYV